MSPEWLRSRPPCSMTGARPLQIDGGRRPHARAWQRVVSVLSQSLVLNGAMSRRTVAVLAIPFVVFGVLGGAFRGRPACLS